MSDDQLLAANRPQERHADFMSLRDTLREIAKEILVKILLAMMAGTLAVTGILFQIWITQRDQSRDMASMSADISGMKQQLETTNERVQRMWWAGGFDNTQQGQKGQKGP